MPPPSDGGIVDVAELPVTGLGQSPTFSAASPAALVVASAAFFAEVVVDLAPRFAVPAVFLADSEVVFDAALAVRAVPSADFFVWVYVRPASVTRLRKP